jgi:hypothetical protein
MMLERFMSVRLFDVCLITIAWDAEDLVIVLCLAALDRGLCALKLPTEHTHVTVCTLKLSLLKRSAEVQDRVFILLLVCFEGARLEGQRGFSVNECSVVSGELPVM